MEEVMQQFIITTEADSTPVQTSQLRSHLLLGTDSSFDTELGEMLLASQKLLTDEIGEFVTDTSIRQPYKSFSSTMPLVHKNIRSITSIQYYDSNNTLQTLDRTSYIFDNNGRSKQVLFTTLPDVELSATYPYPVFINYVASMGDTPPQTILQAILICAAEMWHYRTNSNDRRRYSNLINGSFLTDNLKRRR